MCNTVLPNFCHKMTDEAKKVGKTKFGTSLRTVKYLYSKTYVRRSRWPRQSNYWKTSGYNRKLGLAKQYYNNHN